MSAAPTDSATTGAFAPPGGRPATGGMATGAPRSGPGGRGLRRRRRPGVLDASRTALIPLRPLTIGEILDASFVVLRANARHMIMLPLVTVGALVALFSASSIGLFFFGDLFGTLWVVLIAFFGTLAGVPILVAGITWVSSALTRISLQTVLGPGFAPAPPRLDVRGLLRLLPPMIGLIFLQVVAYHLTSLPAGLLAYGLALPIQSMTEGVATAYSIGVLVLVLLVFALGVSFSALTVPIYTAESRGAPGWIGKPHKSSNVLSVYARSFRLIGLRNAVRVMLVNAATLVIGGVLLAVIMVGTAEFVAAFVQAFVTSEGSALWAILGIRSILVVLAIALVPTFSAWLAYFAAVQTVLYVDLRMRREGLDLAMRFDDVEVPQHSPGPPIFVMPPPAAGVRR